MGRYNIIALVTIPLMVICIPLTVVGIVLTSENCSSDYRNCTEVMREVWLNRTDQYRCGFDCYKPEYIFQYAGGECSVIDDQHVYNYDQVYYAYINWGVCDLNESKYNSAFLAGIILLCVGAPIAITASILFCIALNKRYRSRVS